MRVISGSARGRRLKEPVGADTRPTTDKVKESVFNIIQFDIEGRRVLDAFTGTGQLAIEALSRGAASAVLLDASPKALALAKTNVTACGFGDRAELYNADAVTYLSRGGKFDLVFLDPPYDSDLLRRCLEEIFAFDILRQNGIIVCESRNTWDCPQIPAPYRLHKQYRYGQVLLTVLTRDA